jgi:hypothetical protein
VPQVPDAVHQAIANAQRQQQAQEMMLQALQNTLQNPHTVKRALTNMLGVAQEGQQAVLLVALPSGERWEIPMSPQSARTIGRQLLGVEDPSES